MHTALRDRNGAPGRALVVDRGVPSATPLPPGWLPACVRAPGSVRRKCWTDSFRAHPSVALSSAQVLPEWTTSTPSCHDFSSDGDNPHNTTTFLSITHSVSLTRAMQASCQAEQISAAITVSCHHQHRSCLSRCDRFWNCECYWIRCGLPVTVGSHPGRSPIQTRGWLREEEYVQAVRHE